MRDRLQGLRAYVHDRERAIAAVRLRNVRLEGTLLRLTRAPRRHQVLLVLKPEEVGDVVEVLRTVELELWDVDVGVEECVDVVWVELWVVGVGVEDVVE